MENFCKSSMQFVANAFKKYGGKAMTLDILTSYCRLYILYIVSKLGQLICELVKLQLLNILEYYSFQKIWH